VRRAGHLSLLFAVLALSACQKHTTRPDCPAGKVCLEYGNNSEVETLDPQKSMLLDDSAVISDLIIGLTTDGPDGEPIPGLARSWETSADGLVWTFHLRDAVWSDGVHVTADDFVYAYQRILNPKTASVYAYLVYILKNGRALNEGKVSPEALGAKALDDWTLQLTLEHPAPYLPEFTKHLSFFPIPKHVVEKWGEAWTQPPHFVGNGPFKLMSWSLGDHIEVDKSPTFYDAGRVCIDRVNYYPTNDSIMAERRIRKGELDINTSFQSNRIDRIRSNMPGIARTHISLATSYMSFNTRDMVAFRDIRVRRALSEAIDREFITRKLMRAGQAPAYAFVPPGTAGYRYGAHVFWSGQTRARRVADARRSLLQAGYGPDNPLTFQIKTSNNPDSILISQAVQADWAEIGVNAKVIQNESQIAFAAYRMRDFDVGIMNWYADFNDATTFLDLFKSDTGGQNYGDYKNPTYDALLNAADQEPDIEKRADLLSQAEQVMLNDEATIPLFFVVNRNLVATKVTGWVDNAANFHRARWLCVKPG